MGKIIVLSGHGDWDVLGAKARGEEDVYTTLPGQCSIKFYTLNMRTLSDALGGNIDRGIVDGLKPDQEGGPWSTVPNMTLYPPTGLHIRTPDPAKWDVIELPAAVPTGNKNLQVRIAAAYPGGGDLKTILDILRPAMIGHEVTILWAACRAINLAHVRGQSIGVNSMQR